MLHHQEFRDWLVRRLKDDLPGEKAQYNLAPLKRKEEEKLALRHNKAPRPSSVMLILYPQNGITHIPMIVRNEYKGVHSGQVALPGGKFEKPDKDILETAIRETNEEINVLVSKNQVIGKLSHLFVPVSNYIIHPYIAWFDERPSFVPDTTEVQKILEVPLSHITDKSNHIHRKIPTAGGFVINAPGIPIEDHFLWGATAMLMSEFLAILGDLRLS